MLLGGLASMASLLVKVEPLRQPDHNVKFNDSNQRCRRCRRIIEQNDIMCETIRPFRFC